MIKADERRVLHEYIILDMAVRSLQQDYASLEELKMSKVYIEIFDTLLKNLRNDLYNRKRILAKWKIRVVKWENIDEYFSDVTVANAGDDVVLRYAKQALKSQVEKKIMMCIKIESVPL